MAPKIETVFTGPPLHPDAAAQLAYLIGGWANNPSPEDIEVTGVLIETPGIARISYTIAGVGALRFYAIAQLVYCAAES